MPRKVKLSKSEQLDRDVRRWQRAQERALIMERKAAKLLKRSAVELAKLYKRQLKLDREPVPPPTPGHPEVTATAADGRLAKDGTVPLAELGTTEIGKANRESWNATHPIPPKRKRKAELKRSIDEVVTDLNSKLDPTRGMEPVDREAKMKAMGFRKTSNRRKPSSVESTGS